MKKGISSDVGVVSLCLWFVNWNEALVEGLDGCLFRVVDKIDPWFVWLWSVVGLSDR